MIIYTNSYFSSFIASGNLLKQALIPYCHYLGYSLRHLLVLLTHNPVTKVEDTESNQCTNLEVKRSNVIEWGVGLNASMWV